MLPLRPSFFSHQLVVVYSYLRKDLVPRITNLAERFAVDNNWYLETMNSLFKIAGDHVHPDVAHNVMRLISEGQLLLLCYYTCLCILVLTPSLSFGLMSLYLSLGTDDEEADAELRLYAAESYIEMLEQQGLPDSLVQIMCWVSCWCW